MITTANEIGGIRPAINLRKKTQLLATMQRRRKKIGKMTHKECIGTRALIASFLLQAPHPTGSMLFKSCLSRLKK